jgi:hypothetical protein
MSVFYRPQKRPNKPWRAVVVIKGVRFERWFATEEEAQKAHNHWSSGDGRSLRYHPKCPVVENEAECGEPVKAEGMCNRHYLRWKRHGDPLYRHHKGRGLVDEAEIIPAPCGSRIVGTETPRRCKLHLECPVNRYGECLDIALKNNWNGWISL